METDIDFVKHASGKVTKAIPMTNTTNFRKR